MKLLIIIYLFVIAFTYKPDSLIDLNYAMAVLKTSAKWWLALIIPYLYVISIESVVKKNK